MNREHRAIAILAALLATTALLAACSPGDKGAGRRQRPAPLVDIASVEGRDVLVTVRAPVDLRPIAQADVSSKVLGFLDTVLVDRGDRVRKGQLVATVRPSDLPDQLAAERSALAQLRANAALATANAARAETLTKDGLVSQQELEQLATARASAQAQESGARSRIEALAIKLGETRIEAPLDGIVSVRRLDPGVLVGPGGASAILTIVQSSTLRVSIPIQERDVHRVKLGQEAFVSLDSFPDRTFSGTVVRLAPAMDLATRTLDAEILIVNDEDLLRPGMYGRGSIVLEKHLNAPVAPVGAVVINSHGTFVYVVDGEKVQRRAVTTGVDGGDWLEIKTGLTVGERIVVAGTDSLSDGARIRTQPNPGAPATNAVR